MPHKNEVLNGPVVFISMLLYESNKSVAHVREMLGIFYIVVG